MVISIIKTVIIAVILVWVVGLVAPMMAFPAVVWTLLKVVVVVWAVFEILKNF